MNDLQIQPLTAGELEEIEREIANPSKGLYLYGFQPQRVARLLATVKAAQEDSKRIDGLEKLLSGLEFPYRGIRFMPRSARGVYIEGDFWFTHTEPTLRTAIDAAMSSGAAQ